jgi:hypothetical protein
MKSRPKDGKPLTFSCNEWLDHSEPLAIQNYGFRRPRAFVPCNTLEFDTFGRSVFEFGN